MIYDSSYVDHVFRNRLSVSFVAVEIRFDDETFKTGLVLGKFSVTSVISIKVSMPQLSIPLSQNKMFFVFV